MNLLLGLVLMAAPTELVIQSDGSSFYETPDSLWIAPGTLTAVSQGDTLSARLGTSGSRTGVYFDPPPCAGCSVTLGFDTLGLNLPSTVSIDLSAVSRRTVETDEITFENPFQEHGLYISGSKRIGFSVGDGGGLDQGTRISVDGTAAPGITVTGSVTDRNLAAGASSSELVSQLDRIFFLVDGGSWNARLGDMEWLRGDGETGPLSWRREISGIDAWTEIAGSYSASSGYGTSGDTRKRTVFFTTEGLQGPYDVTSGWEIVPGSERVWLDGQLMQRGATKDYVMEYAAGLITFTSARLIRSDQRVEITYFQRGDGFRKDLAQGSAGYATGPFQLGFHGFLEEDDRSSPLGFVLTEEAEEVLREAGEDPSQAWVDGAVQVGEGNGSYSLDSLGPYVYEGPNQGEWDVVFGRPPSGAGDYVYNSGVGGYVWVGAGSGTHLPRQYVQIPAGYRTGGMSVEYDGEMAGMDLQTAFSSRTGNMFNPEETTREGICITGSAGFSFWRDGPGLGVDGMLLSSGYRPPGDLEADSTLEAWYLPPGYTGRDNVLQVSAGGRRLLVSGAGRFMEDGGLMERYRAVSRPSLSGLETVLRGSYSSRINTAELPAGTAGEVSLSSAGNSGILRPLAGMSYAREEWEDSISGDVTTGFAGVNYVREGSTAGIRLELQKDTREGSASPGPFRVWRTRLQGSGPAGSLRYQGSLEHSSTYYSAGGELHADAIRISLSGSFGNYWMESIYSGSGTVSQSLDVIYTYAGEGEGEYSYDPQSGEYYPDPEGDYVVVYQPGGQGEALTEASLETAVTYSSTLTGFSGTARVSSASSDSRTRALLLYGAFDSEQEGGYSLNLSPWLRWEENLLSRLTLTGRLKDLRTAYSGTGLKRERLWRLKVEPELTPSDQLSVRTSASIWRRQEELYSPRDIRGTRLELDPTWEPVRGFRPGLALAWESRTDRESGLEANMLEAAPHVSWTGGGWTASSRVTAGYIPGEEDLPIWFFDGSGRGVSWLATARVGRNLSSGLDISLFYWGRRPAGMEWSQRAGLEGTVNF